MSDVLNSIDTQKFKSGEAAQSQKTVGKDATINTGKLRKQMKTLKKVVEKSPVLDKPITGRKRMKMDRE